MTKRILLIYTAPNLDTNPTMRQLLRALPARGIEIDVLTLRGKGFLEAEAMPGVTYRYVSPLFLRTLGLLNPLHYAARLRRWIFGLHGLGGYDAYVGVDPTGLVIAGEFARMRKRPVIYISFEIIGESDIETDFERHFKECELRASRDVVLTLVQDEERAAVLAEANGLARETMHYVPVSPEPLPVPESNYLRDRLDIAPEKRIVLMAGSVETWSGRELLSHLVASWPERFVLVLHTRNRQRGRMRVALDELCAHERILLSDEPLPANRLPELYASADFGLAMYVKTPDTIWSGGNLTQVGLASGKVAWSVLCGLPVLATETDTFTRLFPQYECGKTFRYLHETGAALEAMDAEYEKYVKGARAFYAAELDPRARIDTFCDAIRDVIA